MSGAPPVGSFDVDSIVECARALWRDASARARHHRIELYAKCAERVRMERGHSIGLSSFRRAHETGIAMRALTASADGAGFAASAGLSREAARWVLERAVAGDSRVSGVAPDASAMPPDDLRDLDPIEMFPSREDLLAAVERESSVDWIEAGRTVEVLIGTGGWCAVRRRHRVWGLVQADATRLFARRRLDGWLDALNGKTKEMSQGIHSNPSDDRSVTLLPDAVSPIVLALAGRFHLGEPSNETRGGGGWTVDDDPFHPDGLSGGVFDDAGFKTEVRALALDGGLSGVIGGPGSFWRRSFREPPTPTPSSLTMPPGGLAESLQPGPVADRSRLIKLSQDVWVLELELLPDHVRPRRRSYARVSPGMLLGACAARVGHPQVTADGPVVPALRFDQLPIVLVD